VQRAKMNRFENARLPDERLARLPCSNSACLLLAIRGFSLVNLHQLKPNPTGQAQTGLQSGEIQTSAVS